MLATELIDRAARGDRRQTLQSLAERFNVLSREYRMPAAEAHGWVQPFQSLFAVAAADESELAVAVIAVEQHGRWFWDAMLWATARRAGCRVLLSEDFQDGCDLGGILFVNPFAPPTARCSTSPCRSFGAEPAGCERLAIRQASCEPRTRGEVQSRWRFPWRIGTPRARHR